MNNVTKYWTETFGHNICVMSTGLAMSPQDTAVLLASAMGGIAGRHAGLHDLSRPRTHPGFNLLLSSEQVHRTRRTMEICLGPLASMQEYLRDVSVRTSRSLGDLHKFGLKGGTQGLEGLTRQGKLYDRILNLWRDGEEDLDVGDSIPTEWWRRNSQAGGEWDGRVVSERLPGVRYGPSILHWTSDLTHLEGVISDSFDQQLLVADAGCDFFRGSFTTSSKQGNAAMRTLATLLTGKEVEIPRLHPDQGHARFRRAHVYLFAVMSLDQISEMLERASNDGGATLLEQALLLRPNWQPIRSCGAVHDAPAFGHYQTALRGILNARIQRSGQGVPLVVGEPEKFAALESQYFQALDAVPQHLHSFLGPFANLLPRLAWAFKLLRHDNEPDWCLKGVEAAAHHALKSHTEILSAALARNEQGAQERTASRIMALLQKNGPSGTREIQRRIYNCRQADIAPVLEKLLAEQRVKLLPGGRQYELATTQVAGTSTARLAVAAQQGGKCDAP